MLKPDSAASADPKVEKRFRAARDLFKQGDEGLADEAFARLIDDYPSDPLARVSLIYRARIALARDDPKRARSLLQNLKGATDPVAERAAFYDGVALYALEQYAEAFYALRPFVGRLTDREENLLLLDTLWRAAIGNDDKSQSVLFIDKYLNEDKPDSEAHRAALNALQGVLQKTDDVELLENVALKLTPSGEAWPLVMSRLSKVYFEKGDLDAAKEVLAIIEKEERNNVESVQKITKMIEQRATVDLKTVGLIVPLTGRSRLIGETVVKGAMLAAKKHDLSVTIRDSKGDPDVAAEAVNELVSVEHAAAIVGPVNSAAATAAAKVAENLDVPLLTLSIRENLSEGSFVFRDFVSNKAEVKALVTKAREVGNESFGIFYPENGYGRKMRELYKAELDELGLEIKSEVSYPTNVTQFKEQAEKIATEEIDVLFVPDTAARLALLAPALAAAGLWSARTGDEPKGPGKAVQLLISSTGLAPDLIRRTGRYMDGAYFATYFTPNSSTSAAEFEDNYYREYGSTPDFLAAFAHDCVTLVAWAIKEGSTDRDALREWLQDVSQNSNNAISMVAPFDGFTANGEPLASPWIEQLLGGELQLVR